MKQDAYDIKTPNMQTVSDFKKIHNPKSMSISMRSKVNNSPVKVTRSPNETKLKLYGPLKINRYEIGDNDEKALLKIPTGAKSVSNKTIYYSDKDNNWNNPKWCKDEKLAVFYHGDKLRRDCISLDNLMQATLRDEKKKFKKHKG